VTGTGQSFRAEEMALELRDFLSRRQDIVFQVHSAFKKAVNLLTSDRVLVTLVGEGRDLTPMGAVVPKLHNLLLPGGSRVSFSEGVFSLPDNQGVIDTRGAVARHTRLPGPLSAGRQDQVLALIRDKLAAADKGGIASLVTVLPGKEKKLPPAPLNMYSAFILKDLGRFLQACQEDDLDRAAGLARALIGFGPGLTPSCDDFMTGILLSFYYLPGRGPEEHRTACFFGQIEKMALERTNLISYHMIRHAVRGHAGLLYLEALRAAGAGDLAAMGPVIDRLLDFGASSGADFLYGLYCGQILLPKPLAAVHRPVFNQEFPGQAGDFTEKMTG
jgi:hypothetical protein